MIEFFTFGNEWPHISITRRTIFVTSNLLRFRKVELHTRVARNSIECGFSLSSSFIPKHARERLKGERGEPCISHKFNDNSIKSITRRNANKIFYLRVIHRGKRWHFIKLSQEIPSALLSVRSVLTFLKCELVCLICNGEWWGHINGRMIIESLPHVNFRRRPVPLIIIRELQKKGNLKLRARDGSATKKGLRLEIRRWESVVNEITISKWNDFLSRKMKLACVPYDVPHVFRSITNKLQQRNREIFAIDFI